MSGPVSSRSSVLAPDRRVPSSAWGPLSRLPKERPGPPGGKRDVNRRRRIQAIGRAALKLFLERGVEAVTIDDIAHEAGIAKGSFYRYFADKEELVAALFEPVAHRAREAFFRCEEALRGAHDRASLLTAYQGLARDLIPLATEHGDEVRLYLQEHRTPPVGARAPIRALALEVEQRAVHLTKVAVDRGLLRISDPRISALAVIGAVEQLALALFAGRLDASPSLVATTLIELVLEGIRIRS